ncbi:hypothetical protein GOEFS_044_00400 [Gordonia effusa NBRC 100432]|uniref:DUF3592 domain-containing protein n=1 Tax=Gordonia effusa NBRC 100432 TaxID=1077974 RepID=H0QYV3_9ACTN|nr:DUF3592 domain-containing protein [Gordonia effusa]GAB18004.1 hypothetical protein GOEFS_044_00400 [Gordonia effusa NBRC 100432]
MNPTVQRYTQIVLLCVGGVVTALAVVLVAGCYHNDSQINANKATVIADVVSADALHAAVNLQTPDGQIYSPRLGLLYPTELAVGERISVDYDITNPDLARPTGRDWKLSLAPALSIAVIGWLAVAVVMVLVAEASRRLRLRRASATNQNG